jgi:hypothetical protein
MYYGNAERKVLAAWLESQSGWHADNDSRASGQWLIRLGPLRSKLDSNQGDP